MRFKRYLPYLPIVLIPALGLAYSLTFTLTRPLTSQLGKVAGILRMENHSYWTAADLQGDFQTVTQGGASSAPDAILGAGATADSNDPVYLDWQPTSADPGYVYLDGASGSYISQADEAGNSVTGDQTWIVKVALDDFSSGTQTLFSKWETTGNQRSILVQLDATATVTATTSADGTATATHTSTATLSMIDGEIVYLKFDYDVSAGTIAVSTSSDGETYAALETLTGLSTSVYDGTAPIEIGSAIGGTSNLATGKFYELQLKSGIDGTVVSQWRGKDMSESGGPDSAPTPLGNWTLNGTYSVAKPSGVYVYLPGSASNNLTSTDPALTGDQTWTIWQAADAYASGGSQTLMSVWNSTGSQLAWRISLTSTGNVEVRISSNGVTSTNKNTPSAVSALDGEWFGIQGRYDASAGTCEILTSVDGETWSTQATLTAFPTSIFDSSANLIVGSMQAGALNHYAGKVGWATIHDNATGAGDPVWRWDSAESTQSGYSDPYSSAANTINRSATGLKSTLVTRPVFVFNASGPHYSVVADDDDLEIAGDLTAWVYGRYHDTEQTDGIWLSKKQTGSPYDGYEIRFDAATGKPMAIIDGDTTVTVTAASVLPTATATLLADIRDTAATTVAIYDGVIKTTADTSTASWENGLGLYTGARPDASLPNDFEVWAWGVIKGTALTSQQLFLMVREVELELGGRTGE